MRTRMVHVLWVGAWVLAAFGIGVGVEPFLSPPQQYPGGRSARHVTNTIIGGVAATVMAMSLGGLFVVAWLHDTQKIQQHTAQRWFWICGSIASAIAVGFGMSRYFYGLYISWFP